MSGPRVGDKVRCTLGESVIVGVVTYADAVGWAGCYVTPDFDKNIVWVDAWTIEKLSPLPEIEGTVVLAGSKSLAWQLGYDGLWHTPGRSGTSTANLIKYHSPLTVMVPEVTP